MARQASSSFWRMKNKQSLNCFEVLQNCSWLVLGDVKLQRDKLQSGRKQLSDLHLLCLTTPHHTFQPTPEIIYLNFLTCLVNSSRTFEKHKNFTLLNLNWLTLILMFNRYMPGNWSKSQHLFTEVHNYETLKTQVKCSY